MPLDEGNLVAPSRGIERSEDWRIYACETGNIRIETKHYRQTFEPEEFVALLRQIFRKNDSRSKRQNRI
jgi:hypothetical protein